MPLGEPAVTRFHRKKKRKSWLLLFFDCVHIAVQHDPASFLFQMLRFALLLWEPPLKYTVFDTRARPPPTVQLKIRAQ